MYIGFLDASLYVQRRGFLFIWLSSDFFVCVKMLFLDATAHNYKRRCLFNHSSVSPSVGRMVCNFTSFKLCVTSLDWSHFSLCYNEINQRTQLVNSSFLRKLCEEENFVTKVPANHMITRFSTIIIKTKVDFSQIWALREYDLLQYDIS